MIISTQGEKNANSFRHSRFGMCAYVDLVQFG